MKSWVQFGLHVSILRTLPVQLNQRFSVPLDGHTAVKYSCTSILCSAGKDLQNQPTPPIVCMSYVCVYIYIYMYIICIYGIIWHYVSI